MLGHKEIIKMGNPILRKTAKPYTKEEILLPETRDLISRMWRVMDEAGGIGLAAPQIAISRQLTVIRLEDSSERYPGIDNSPEFVIFNPEVSIIDKASQGFWEGCLSIPALRGYVERPKKILVKYLNEKAQPKEVELEGFLATVFQHEIDHLFGKLYIDRISNTELIVYEEEIDKLTSKDD
jgi:peptide deformylase